MKSPFSRDQDIIETFLAQETKLLNQYTTDNDFIQFFVDTLSSLKKENITVIAVIGGPGSGKSTFVKSVIEKLQKKGIHADSVTTEDFNIHDRKTRDNLIKKGANPLDFKNFKHLNMLLEKVKSGETIHVPLYDRTTGKAMDLENHTHVIPEHLDFLFVEGDFQPVESPDLRIYFHVPTDVRRENRVTRDLAKHALKSAREVRESFDFRLESQYYPYTLPHHASANIIVNVSAEKKRNGEYEFTYFYNVHKKN